MCSSKTEVADILRGLGDGIEKLGLNGHQLRTLSALKKCRTAELGGHVDACRECGVVRISYNSCRNRHCPKCQGNKREEWIQKRNEELLPVPYFHLVFTLPDKLNTLCLHNPKVLYDILFKSVWETMRKFGKKQGVVMGMIAVLHTWGQTLTLHPHLHCIVPGGGVDKNQKWRNIRHNGKYLFPVKALSEVFRAKFVSHLRKTELADQQLINSLFGKFWVVYAKQPFAHPSHVIEYLGRYTHKVAISNHRIRSYENGKVIFSYKDYCHGNVKKEMELEESEFIRRFAMHIVPIGFVRIRHYGILSSTSKRKSIPLIRCQLPDVKAVYVEPRQVAAYDPQICPCCGKAAMVTIATFTNRGPPPVASAWNIAERLSGETEFVTLSTL